MKKNFKVVEIITLCSDSGLSFAKVFENLADPLNFELTPYLDVRYAVVTKKGTKRTVVPLVTVPKLFEEEGSEITPLRIKRLKKKGPVVIMKDPFAQFIAKKDKSYLVGFPEIKLEVEQNMLYEKGSVKRKKISNEEFEILQETPPIEVEEGKIHEMIVENFRGLKELAEIVKEAQTAIDSL